MDFQYLSYIKRSIFNNNQINLDLELKWEEKEKVFDPIEVYGDTPNPTKL